MILTRCEVKGNSILSVEKDAPPVSNEAGKNEQPIAAIM